MGKTFPELQEHQARIEKALGTAKPKMIEQGKTLLSANCEQYIEEQGFDAAQLLNLIAAKHQADETITYKELYETCHKSGGKWAKNSGWPLLAFALVLPPYGDGQTASLA